jgi:hypothetical protein
MAIKVKSSARKSANFSGILPSTCARSTVSTFSFVCPLTVSRFFFVFEFWHGFVRQEINIYQEKDTVIRFLANSKNATTKRTILNFWHFQGKKDQAEKRCLAAMSD